MKESGPGAEDFGERYAEPMWGCSGNAATKESPVRRPALHELDAASDNRPETRRRAMQATNTAMGPAAFTF